MVAGIGCWKLYHFPEPTQNVPCPVYRFDCEFTHTLAHPESSRRSFVSSPLTPSRWFSIILEYRVFYLGVFYFVGAILEDKGGGGFSGETRPQRCQNTCFLTKPGTVPNGATKMSEGFHHVEASLHESLDPSSLFTTSSEGPRNAAWSPGSRWILFWKVLHHVPLSNGLF